MYAPLTVLSVYMTKRVAPGEAAEIASLEEAQAGEADGQTDGR